MTFGQRVRTTQETGRVREIGSFPQKSEMQSLFYRYIGFGRMGEPEMLDGTQFPAWMKHHRVGKLVIEGRIGIPTCYVTGAELPFHPDGKDRQDWNPVLIAVSGYHHRADEVVVAAGIADFARDFPAFAFEEARKMLKERKLFGQRGRHTLNEAVRVLKEATLPQRSKDMSNTSVREQQAALAAAFQTNV